MPFKGEFYRLKKEGYGKFEFNLFDILSYFAFPGLIKLIIKYRKKGWEEMKLSWSKLLFFKSTAAILDGISMEDIEPYTPGIRAQALYANGQLEDDFLVKQDGFFFMSKIPHLQRQQPAYQ